MGRKAKEPACTHVAVEMVAYMSGSVLSAGAGDHVACLWCSECGALVYKRYAGREASERVVFPRRTRPEAG